MSSITPERAESPARTHVHAAGLLRRPFAPGAIGFRAMMKVPYDGDPFGGAQVAAYIGAQSVVQRLNAVVPGRWRQEFRSVEPPPGAKKLYLACRLTITLPTEPDCADLDAVYDDVGEMDGSSRAGLKALYSDARKRAGVAAGIGAYLYTALEPVVLPIGPGERQVQLLRRSNRPDVLTLSPATEEWLRRGYAQRMSTDAVTRDLGEILAHGEPEHGTGQGEAAENAEQEANDEAPARAFWEGSLEQRAKSGEQPERPRAVDGSQQGNGVVVVDFGGVGPEAA